MFPTHNREVKSLCGVKQMVGQIGGGQTALRQDQTSTRSKNLTEVQTKTSPKAV